MAMTVQALLSDPSKWTRRIVARDAQGDGVEPDDQAAVCWCLSGALERCYKARPAAEYAQVLLRLFEADHDIAGCDPRLLWKRGTSPSVGDMLLLTDCLIATWNDAPARTFRDIRRVIEAADI